MDMKKSAKQLGKCAVYCSAKAGRCALEGFRVLAEDYDKNSKQYHGFAVATCMVFITGDISTAVDVYVESQI